MVATRMRPTTATVAVAGAGRLAASAGRGLGVRAVDRQNKLGVEEWVLKRLWMSRGVAVGGLPRAEGREKVSQSIDP